MDSSTLRLVDSQPTCTPKIEIYFDDPLAPVATGTCDVAPWPAAVSIDVATATSLGGAVTGTVTFDQFYEYHVRGTGTIELDSGGTWAFAFDVDIVITRDISAD